MNALDEICKELIIDGIDDPDFCAFCHGTHEFGKTTHRTFCCQPQAAPELARLRQEREQYEAAWREATQRVFDLEMEVEHLKGDYAELEALFAKKDAQ
jgi:hypothetical protein